MTSVRLLEPMNVTGCARCGGTHFDLEPEAFSKSAVVGGITLTHWVTCPISGDPILIETVEDKLT